jgi:hypothetical protein
MVNYNITQRNISEGCRHLHTCRRESLKSDLLLNAPLWGGYPTLFRSFEAFMSFTALKVEAVGTSVTAVNFHERSNIPELYFRLLFAVSLVRSYRKKSDRLASETDYHWNWLGLRDVFDMLFLIRCHHLGFGLLT